MAAKHPIGTKRADAALRLIFATNSCRRYAAEQKLKGVTIVKIAEDLGVSETTVRTWLKDNPWMETE